MRAAAFALLLLAVAGALPVAGQEPVPHALESWDNAARLALPIWLKLWLGVLER